MEQTYGLQETYSFDKTYIEAETVGNLAYELYTMLGYAILTVTLVVLFITFDIRMTFFVICQVSLVVIYMVGICQIWGLTLNHVMALNLAFALGVAIDFSVHIAHKYLVIVPSAKLKTTQE